MTKVQPTVYRCGRCKKPIDGEAIIVEGNVYRSIGDMDRGGVIGNMFPTADDRGFIRRDAVCEFVSCVSCFTKILGLVVLENDARST
jgi:hypothetical protein